MTTEILRVRRDFYRAHGLGNDYLVFEAGRGAEEEVPLGPDSIRKICRRGEGVGSDGIVVLLERAPADGVFPLRMFNPDGSEFERSGNGLRVLASHLRREGLVGEEPLRVRSGGAVIPMKVHGTDEVGVHDVSVEMGRAQVGPGALSLDPSALDEEGRAVHPDRGPLAFVPVSVGNPHAVVFTEDLSEDALRAVGPFLTKHPAFPSGANVQLVRILGGGGLRIGIWERGVGPTPASGTSSCAAAVAAVHTGRLAPGPVQVEMEGGVLDLEVTAELDVVLRGPVAEVATGRLTEGFSVFLEGGG